MVAVTGATAATSPIPRLNLVASAHAIQVIIPRPKPATSRVAKRTAKLGEKAEPIVARPTRPRAP